MYLRSTTIIERLYGVAHFAACLQRRLEREFAVAVAPEALGLQFGGGIGDGHHLGYCEIPRKVNFGGLAFGAHCRCHAEAPVEVGLRAQLHVAWYGGVVFHEIVACHGEGYAFAAAGARGEQKHRRADDEKHSFHCR